MVRVSKKVETSKGKPKRRKTKKVKRDFSTQVKRWMIARIRNIWGWSPQRKEALKKAYVGGMYKCAGCGDLLPSQSVTVDHVIPVVEPGSVWSWDIYINRMLFCGIDNLQVLCRPCHSRKSKEENKCRSQILKKPSV